MLREQLVRTPPNFAVIHYHWLPALHQLCASISVQLFSVHSALAVYRGSVGHSRSRGPFTLQLGLDQAGLRTGALTSSVSTRTDSEVLRHYCCKRVRLSAVVVAFSSLGWICERMFDQFIPRLHWFVSFCFV